jgi:zinc protease
MNDWRETPPGPAPIRPYSAPTLRGLHLENGLRCVVVPHGVVPVVTAMLTLDAGAMCDPAGKAGLAHLTAQALDAGAAGRDADALATAFEQLGADFEAAASWDALRVEVTVAADRIEAALALLADVVRRPDFPPHEITRLREEQLASLLQRQADPRALAGDMAIHFIYADGSRYGAPLAGDTRQVEILDRDDVADFHRQRFRPAGAALLLVGAIEAGQADRLCREHFGDWTGDAPAAVRVNAAARHRAARIFLVHRPGSVQSEIRVGHPGVHRTHPDHYALEVFNTLHGGAFTSRLNMNLRERHGFTYGVRSGFAYRREAGPFMIQTAVATEVTAAALREIVNETRGLLDQGPTADEIASARDYLAGVLPLALQTTEQLARAAADIVTYGLNEDYLQHHARAILDVEADDAWRAARDHIHLDRLAITIVGDADRIADEIDALGVAPIDRSVILAEAASPTENHSP